MKKPTMLRRSAGVVAAFLLAMSWFSPMQRTLRDTPDTLTLTRAQLNDMRLTDYKVRVLNHGAATAAITRVLIESTDGESVWTTVGVSSDVIKASFRALVDSIEYKLMKDTGRK